MRRYQAGEMDPWSGVILDAMASRLITAAGRLQPGPGVMDREDLRQQLAVEILAAARCLRLDAEAWIPRMLMERALRNVRRWRRRQLRLDTCELPDGFVGQDSAGSRFVERPALPILVLAGVTPADADVLFRHQVLGESFATIALSLGVTEVALRSRAFRAAEKVRTCVAGNGVRSAWLTSR